MARVLILIFTTLLSFSAQAYMSAMPSFVSFPYTEIGGIGSTQSVTIMNQSTEGLNVSSSSTCSSDFMVMNSCFYLGAYGSCNINIQFNPKMEGPQSCSISINAFGPNGGFTSISLSGTGVKKN